MKFIVFKKYLLVIKNICLTLIPKMGTIENDGTQAADAGLKRVPF
jgi:hypothetical protein